MSLAQDLQTNAFADLATLLKAAGDELRLSVLQALAKDSYGVLELADAFGVKQSGMSHHLKVLASAGLVETRREGNSIFYRRSALAPGNMHSQLIQALFARLDTLALQNEYCLGLERVWRDRAARSQQFFLENAAKFRAKQDLIAEFEVYRAAATELLEISPVPGRVDALEVGPGAGEFLGYLSRHFDRLTALDNSAQMLAQAKSTAAQQRLENVSFVLGDTAGLAQWPERFDCAVINMVLHHTPSPAQIFHDVSASLKPDGLLLVTELCLHDQVWAQEACGDVWLGFTPEDLDTWASNAGFRAGQSVYLALRNGFQIQLRQFFKSSTDQ